MSHPQEISYEATRLNIPLPGSFEDAVWRYESLVPPLNDSEIKSLSESRAPWNSYVEQAERNAPRFVIDKPSSHFDSYRRREIAQVGSELDQKVACLIALMGAPVPVSLR
ncbi:hypothetical protein [Streptomyces sp. 150FB]|uniref:hypothetical protein n=1 Tax=Streptomyces sp. 150FB TaxID=1576605 RepID=UPI001237319E|nr:hypothetical protein [Streptomyces sp. 150FB]